MDDAALTDPVVVTPRPATPSRHRRMSGSAGRAWTVLIVAAGARAVLLVGVGLLIWAALPAVWGWVPTTVSSDSMAPAIRTGDVIVAMPASSEDLKLGQVLLVRDPDHPGGMRLHRFVSIDASGDLVLKGDANLADDSSHIPIDDVIGVGVLRVPLAGLPGMWLRNGNLGTLVAWTAAAGILLWLSRADASYFRPPRPARGVVKKGALIAAALVVFAGAVPTSYAEAAFSRTTVNPASALSTDAAYPCLSPAVLDTPYFLYRFNASSGTSVVDSSVNVRTGTVLGTTTRVAGSCVVNNSPAITLDGATGVITTPGPAIAGSNVFSVEIWFRTTTVRGGKLIGFGNLQSGVSASYDRHVYMTNTGQLVFGVYPGAVRTITSPLSYNTGAWHHAVATLSPAGMILYVNGVAVATNAATTTAQAYSGFWRIGHDNLTGWTTPPTSSYFGGTIDSAAVYTTALTSGQVSAHFTAGH